MNLAFLTVATLRVGASTTASTAGKTVSKRRDQKSVFVDGVRRGVHRPAGPLRSIELSPGDAATSGGRSRWPCGSLA